MFKPLVLSGLFLGLGLFVCTPLWGGPIPPCVDGNTAGQLCVSPSSASMWEGTGGVSLPFTVTNNTGVTLILDYAMWTVKAGPPDTSDRAFFSSLAGAPTYLYNGQTGVFDFILYSPGDPTCTPTDCDFGVNPVTFSVEMSPGVPGTLPPTPIISSANNPVVWVTFVSPWSGNWNGAAFNDLLNGQDPQLDPNLQPPASDLLYSNGILGLSTVDGSTHAVGSVTVYDAPEPSSALMLGTALALLGCVWRRRHPR
jgi:hypothetical protein